MSRHNVVHLDLSAEVFEPHTTIDRTLRTGLLKVFPLPVAKNAADERFARLLDALAAKSRDDVQSRAMNT